MVEWILAAIFVAVIWYGCGSKLELPTLEYSCIKGYVHIKKDKQRFWTKTEDECSDFGK